MRLRRVCLVLGALTVTGLTGGIVSLAVFATGEAEPVAEQALERCQDLAGQQRFSEALAQCDRAIEEGGDFAEAYVRRAAVYVEMGKFSDALGDARDALRIDKELAAAYLVRARAHLGLGRRDQAMEEVEDAASRDLSPEDSMALAEAYRAVGLWQEAADQATKACRSEVQQACDFSAIPTREEALEVLHTWALTQEDVPPTMIRGLTGYHSLGEESDLSGSGFFASQLQDWGFALAYSTIWYEPESTEGLLQVFSETWLLDGTARIEEVFGDVSAASGVFASNKDDDFPEIGDESRARINDDQFGDVWEVPTQSYIILFRTGPFLTIMNATFAGEANRTEAAALARTIDARIRGD